MSVAIQGSDKYFVCQVHDTGMANDHDLRYEKNPSPLGTLPVLSTALTATGNASYNHSVTSGPGSTDLWVSASKDGATGHEAQYDNQEIRVTKSTGAVNATQTLDVDHGDNPWEKEGRSAIVFDGGGSRDVVHACWTVTPSGASDDTYCAARALASGWSSPVQIGGGSGTQDHSNLAIRAATGERAIVYHDTTVTYGIALRLEDDDQTQIGSVIQLNDGGSGNHPDVADRNGLLAVVWEESDRIYLRTCDSGATDDYGDGTGGATDCTDIGTWTSVVAVDQGSASHTYSSPQVAIDADGDLFVTYEDELAPNTRIRVSPICDASKTLQGSAWQLADNTELDEEFGPNGVIGSRAIALEETGSADRVVVAYTREDSGTNVIEGVSSRIDLAALCL